jgi:hypothetical protein
MLMGLVGMGIQVAVTYQCISYYLPGEHCIGFSLLEKDCIHVKLMWLGSKENYIIRNH